MAAYLVKIRVQGIITTATVEANSAGQAKTLALAQYGAGTTVLSTKRL